MALHFFEITQEPARQIDQMHALVDQFAAAGEFRARRAIPCRSQACRRGRNGRG